MVEALAAPSRVLALTVMPAVLWGLEPVVSKRGMARGGTTLQAAVVVVAVYWTVLAVRRGVGALLVTLAPSALA